MSSQSPSEVENLLVGLCDDAAIFPPGNLPLADAVPAHREHLAAGHAGLVGPFIVTAALLGELAEHLDGLLEPDEKFEVALTVGSPAAVADVLTQAETVPGLRVAALEVVVPEGLAAEDVVPQLSAAVDGRDLDVFVEVPRDERRPALIAALADSGYMAKLRTGGVRAELYPDEAELAEAVVALVSACVPFKATAGLHHALRNTDPETGFEQHGFLNLLNAVDAAQSGADTAQVAAVLAERDPEAVSERARDLNGRASLVREAFRSFGTCSIVEPRDELADLGFSTTQSPEGTPL